MPASSTSAGVKKLTPTREGRQSKAVAWAIERPAIRDPASAIVAVTEIATAADSLPWSTYGGPGARRALEGAFIVAESLWRVAFGLALQDWAERVGQDKRTLETNRDTLLRLGWLQRNANDRPGRTARYTLRKPRDIHTHRGWNVRLSGTRDSSPTMRTGLRLSEMRAGISCIPLRALLGLLKFAKSRL